MSLVERAITCNSLICLLKGLEGKKTTVELRNESTVLGKIISVDAYMNIQMGKAIYTDPSGVSQKFKNFFVQGRLVRFVRIPDDVNIVQTIEEELEKIQRIRTRREPQTKKALLIRKKDKDLLRSLAREEAAKQQTSKED